MAIQPMHTYCAMCVSRCGVLATVEDGRLTKVTADPEHPTRINIPQEIRWYLITLLNHALACTVDLRFPFTAALTHFARALGAAAWVAYARGDREAALDLMRAAADLEDKSEKSAVSPGRLVPAHELLGDMLLESGKSAEALAA